MRNYYPFTCKCCNIAHEAPEHAVKDTQLDMSIILRKASEQLSASSYNRSGREERWRKINKASVYQRLRLDGFI